MHLKPVAFTEMLIEVNGIDPNDFKKWAFFRGMRFNSPDKWWGDYGFRNFPHEGVDLCLFQGDKGPVRRLDEQTRIPVMHAGVVQALFDDYLGKAIILEHENVPGVEGRLMGVYAHTRPQAGIEPGVTVEAGDIIATIADTRRSNPKLLPHLHLSFGFPSPQMVYDPFIWNHMHDPRKVTLVDPLQFFNWPSRDLEVRDVS